VDINHIVQTAFAPGFALNTLPGILVRPSGHLAWSVGINGDNAVMPSH
jgi:hypothetical protein